MPLRSSTSRAPCHFFVRGACLFALGSLATTPARGQEALLVLTTGNVLHKVSSASPSTSLGSVVITGMQVFEGIVAIDFRPSTGQLYGLGSSSRLYVINRATGAATQVGSGAFSTLLNGSDFGMDFNPVSDTIRVVSDLRQNLRINPTTAQVTVDSTLNVVGMPIETPEVVGVAYSNPLVILGSSLTTLYGIDADNNELVRIGGANSMAPSPNTGQIMDSDPLGTIVGPGVCGFDIAPSGVAYATFYNSMGMTSALYTIDLTSGAATLAGGLPGGAIRGLAAIPRPRMSITDVSVAEGDAGLSNATFTVKLSESSLAMVTANFATANDTAAAGSDYSQKNGSLSFSPGQTSKTVTINVAGDFEIEPDETFRVVLSGVVGALGADLEGVATIMSDDLDGDNDGVRDAVDNCPSVANPDQADADADGTGDVCELTPPPGAGCGACAQGVLPAALFSLSLLMLGRRRRSGRMPRSAP